MKGGSDDRFTLIEADAAGPRNSARSGSSTGNGDALPPSSPQRQPDEPRLGPSDLTVRIYPDPADAKVWQGRIYRGKKELARVKADHIEMVSAAMRERLGAVVEAGDKN